MPKHHRVTFFGSARCREESPEYQDIFRISRMLTERGYEVMAVDGPGLMQAARAGSNARPFNIHTGDLQNGQFKLPESERCRHVERHFGELSHRLDTLMSSSDALVVATGGLGTLLELFYCWNFVQVKRVCEIPIILYGHFWTPLLKWLYEEPILKDLVDGHEFNRIFHLSAPEKVVSLIQQIFSDQARMDHVCINFTRYKE